MVKAFVIIDTEDRYYSDYNDIKNIDVFRKDISLAKFYKDKTEAILKREQLENHNFKRCGEYGNYKVCQVKFKVTILE